jgi:hypothetical protein
MENTYPDRNNVYSSLTLDRLKQRQLLRVFWPIALALLTYELFFAVAPSFLSNCGAILITVAALLPIYLWCAGRALGLPIFPLFSITFVWTYALPLISTAPGIIIYRPEQHLSASITIALFLFLATFIWFQFVNRPPPIPPSYRTLPPTKGENFFIGCLTVSLIFNMNVLGGWFGLDFGTFTLIRSVILAVSVLATFALSYRLGSRELTKRQSQWFLFIFITAFIVNSIGLLLVGSASMLVVAVAAFTMGRKQVPIKVIIIAITCLTFLHYGKADMRGKYWFGGQSNIVQPWQYPAWYAEWAGYSIEYLTNQGKSISSKSQEKQSLLERSSVIQIFLLAQERTPQSVPYLNGATYAIIPELLVPRFLTSTKIASHEGTYLLNIHYGKQTREQTARTTIGWGLLAESYANFGELGCMGLGIFLGMLYGQITKWTINAPLLSDRSLLGIVMVSFAFQSEFSMGVFVTAVFQSVVTLGGIVVVLMKPYPTMRG